MLSVGHPPRDTRGVLKVFHSNKPEALVAQLQVHLEAQVGLPPRDLFRTTKLIIASRPLETWLKHQLVHRAGIVANFETWLLRRFSSELIERVFPDRDVLDGEALRDLLLSRFLEGDVSGPELGPVRHYLGPRGGASAELRAVQLAAQLGRVFEEYVFSRREMLASWARGHASPLDGGSELARWQRHLWQRVLASAKGKRVLPTELLEVAPERLITPGEPLFVFGLSFLGTSYHELLVHLARATDVFLFTLTPCMEFWEDVESVRDRNKRFLHKSLELTPEELAKEDPFSLRADECRPLALWGRPGREAVRLLNQATGGKAEGVFVDPSMQAPSLLRRLQADMLVRKPTTRAEQALPVKPFDGIEVARAPSLRRECEFVAGRIWALLQHEPDLRLDDIAVRICAKDAESYVAPLLSAFRENHDLPWQLVGVPFALTSPVVEAALLLLELPLSRFTRADVLRVLTHPVVAGRFPGAEVDAWVRWVDALGIVHGQSHADHQDTYVDRDLLNWDQGLKRLALGAFLSTHAENEERLVELHGERYLADPSGRHLDVGAGAFVLLTRSLLADTRTLKDAELTTGEWARTLDKYLCAYLVPQDDPQRRALDAVLRTVRAFADRQLGDRKVSFLLAKELLRDELAAAGSSSGGAVTGGVRVSTLNASRGIPARVTFIVGLSEGAFPASDRAEALDLRPVRPLAGDANGREKDEYLFLESLLCTNDRLVLSYLARDERTGDARSPSPVVVELLRLLDEGYLGRSVDDPAPHPLVHEVPLWRADSDLKQDALVAPAASGLAERSLRAAGLSLSSPPGTPVREVLESLPEASREVLASALGVLAPPPKGPTVDDQVRRVSISQLRSFLECPLQGSARVRLRLGDEEEELVDRTDEVFNSSARTAVSLLKQSFVDAWRNAGGQAFPPEPAALEQAWSRRAERLVAQGQLPLGVFLEAEKLDALEVLGAWRNAVGAGRGLQVVRFGPAEEHERLERVEQALEFQLSARVQLVGATQPMIGSDTSLLLIRRKFPGAGRDKHSRELLRAWLDHLVLTASAVVAPRPHSVLLAYRDEAFTATLAPVSQEEARGYLQALIEDLLFKDNELLLPLAAVEQVDLQSAEPLNFEALVLNALGGRHPACTGPVRRPERFRIPPDDEARGLIERRFTPFFSRLTLEGKAP